MRPTTGAATRSRVPRPHTSESWTVAAFDQAQPRFLRRDPRGHWVVVSDIDPAARFASVAEARAALERHTTFSTGHARTAGGDWRVWKQATRTTFQPETH